MFLRRRKEERTGFQNGALQADATDCQCDFAMVYRFDASTEERIAVYREKGYVIHLMTGISWGHYTEYLDGDYEKSAGLWEQVLKMNANYPLAFRGIGQAVMREEKYEEAMEYFKLAHDRESYGRAFKLYRKIWVEKNIWWIVVILAVILIVPLVIGRVRRMKWEVNEYERGKIRK